MTNFNSRTFFNKITQVITGNVLRRTIERYNSDFRTQHFNTESHLYAMLFSQLRGLNSLRDIQMQISNNTKLKRMINVPSVSQFSRKNSNRDYRVFEDLYFYLVDYAQRMYSKANMQKELPAIKIIDSTMIDMPFKLAKYFQYDFKQKRSAVKMSTLLSDGIPEKVHIVPGKVNDRKCIDGMIKDPGSIYIFDRGYYNYKWYDNLTNNKYKFITRQPSNACVEEIKSTYVDNDLIFDYEIRLGTDYSGNKTKNTYREILSFDEKGEEFRLLTNIFDIPAQDIINLYKKRWQIELFFKWIKQNLKIKRCIGYSENAVKIQIYTALIAYILIHILKRTVDSKLPILAVTRIVKANLLEDFMESYSYLSSA